jgi:endonuclease/exonuclease/phosphatase family metal-dependent hydrolase
MVANVENAFDGVDQGTEYKEFSSKTSNWSQDVAEAKARRVAKVFETANCPKIIISAEVENQTAADMISAAATKCHYKAYSANEPQTMPIGVAIFTSLPVKSKSLIETGYRPHLRLDFADGLTVIGVHFKSMRDGGDELRQKAAEAVAHEMQKQGNTRTIVAGDFNTEEELLKDVPLTNCSATAKPTHVYHGDWHRLDKIYATKCSQVGRMDDAFLMKGGQPYRSVLYDKHGKTFHEDAGYSDHLPLYMLD